MSENTQLQAVAIGNPSAGLRIFENVDFSGLNATIEALAEHEGTLDAESKQQAIGILNEWQNNVINRLSNHANDMNDFLSFFGETTVYVQRYGNGGYSVSNVITPDVQEDIARRTNTVTEYEAYRKAADALEAKYNDRPESPLHDVDKTQAERTMEQQKYNMESAKYNLDVNRLNRDMERARKVWINAAKANPSMKALLTQAKNYNRGLGKLVDNCKDKATLAKLNVSISSPKVRESLKKLVEFTRGI